MFIPMKTDVCLNHLELINFTLALNGHIACHDMLTTLSPLTWKKHVTWDDLTSF